MMKEKTVKYLKVILILVLSLTTFIFPEERPKPKGKLIVKFEGIKESKGKIKIALCNSADNYRDHENPFIGKDISAKENYVITEFNDLPFGTYAIKAFHDADSNDDLNTNFLGIPVEDYGFSNDARGTFGPPSWERAKFYFDSENQIIEITIK